MNNNIHKYSSALSDDEGYMREALKEAQKALRKNEVPIGAIIVCNHAIIARAHNLTEQLTDVTAHAEMQAFTSASYYLGSKYLQECALYVTLEPCPMCAGAAFWAHIGRIVYGAPDPKRGFRKISLGMLHPKTKITTGVLEKECSLMLKDYFKNKRKK